MFGAGLAERDVVPLDATHRALVSSEDCSRMRELGTPAGQAAADFIEHRIVAYDDLQPMDTLPTAPVHDALCVAYLVDPSVVTGRRIHVDVETRGELTMGRTIMDTRGTRTGTQRLRRLRCRCAEVRVDDDRDVRPQRRV